MSTDVYLKRTAPTGRVIITHHWAWDADRFVANQQAEQRKLAAEGRPATTITLATVEEYRAFTWPRGNK